MRESIWAPGGSPPSSLDRKSTRLNSSHDQISYAVFCLKKKKNSNRPFGVRAFELNMIRGRFTRRGRAAGAISAVLRVEAHRVVWVNGFNSSVAVRELQI